MTTSTTSSNGRSTWSLLRTQIKFDLLVFRRNTTALFFTAVLPLIFLFTFTSIFGNETLGNGTKLSTLYVPGILTLAIVSAAMVNLATDMTSRRERGVLRRVRGTPVPPWVFVLSQGVVALVISTVMTLLIVIVGRVIFGVTLNLHSIPTLIISLVVGATSFAFLGLALTTIIPTETAAPAITNAITLPIYFISDVFIQGDSVPDWVVGVANLLPVRHLAHALQDSFDPFVTQTTWPVGHWAVIAAWGAFGLAVTLRFFRWTPRR